MEDEFMEKELKPGVLVGKRGGPCTPPPTWNLNFPHQKLPNTSVSARKLGANLWEIHPLVDINMSKHGHKNKGFLVPQDMIDHPLSTPHQPASELKKHLASSWIQHPQSMKMNSRALNPISPASCSSSSAVHAVASTSSSLELKERTRNSSHNLKTSTELIKVLNRIWTLEEQHASNMTLAKSAKKEVDHSRARIKTLLQEKHSDRREMEKLIRQVSEAKLMRKNLEKAMNELEDEKKIRKRLDTLHRKLAREISEVNSSLSVVLKELEKERETRGLLEDLCDEFATGIGDYEQEVRSLKHTQDKDHANRENPDRLVLHISETWLDERMQLKLSEARNDLPNNSTNVDKLRNEIETFLQAKRRNSMTSCNRRHSMESYLLNEAISAPQIVLDDDDGDLTDNDSHCVDLIKGEAIDLSSKKHGDEIPGMEKKKVICKGRKSSKFRLHVEERMARAISGNRNNTQMEKKEGSLGENLVSVNKSQEAEIQGIEEESVPIDGKLHTQDNFSREDSRGHLVFTGYASPVQQWNVSKLSFPEDLKQGSKENSLKAKLLEARLEGQHSRSKASKLSL